MDTREHAATLNAAIRDRLVAACAVDDRRVAVTHEGQRSGAGDVIVTRRNNPDVGVANREAWTVTRVHRDGRLVVTDPNRGRRELTGDYARAHVELGYAVTGYGAQGDTSCQAHLVLTEATSAAAAYVAMTRGRHNNVAHLVATDADDAASSGSPRSPGTAPISDPTPPPRRPHGQRRATPGHDHSRRCSPSCVARGASS